MIRSLSLCPSQSGANLNIPYIPLWRRDCDIIISLDASADSQDLWFTRAAEYAQQRSLHLWPRVNPAALFPSELVEVDPANDEKEEEDSKRRRSSSSDEAARKVDEAKAQEIEVEGSSHEKKKQKQEVNPHVPPVGSGPHSAQWNQEREKLAEGGAEEEEGNSKPIPRSSEVGEEPPLGKCK